MKCSCCQFENREGAKFCKDCGNKLELLCPKCGHAYTADAKFCDECGFNLKKQTENPPIDYSKPHSYTPKHLADKILTARGSIEGERKIVTVLFADVANYTAMSEKLDPEEVHQIMDGCFKILIDGIHDYEGTITLFTGDGVMALFGAPVAHENHAQRACYAALFIQNEMQGYGEKIKAGTGIDFKMRIGLNSGTVIVVGIGDDLKMDYTAVGDTVNLASRMEGLAMPGKICVSANTEKIAASFFEFRHMGKTAVKGKDEPQETYELVKVSQTFTRLSVSVANGLTPFVGRENSINALLNCYDRVTSGAGQVVGIVGEAGIGKSRLLFEMRNQLPKDQYTYLEGHCMQYGGSILYKPVQDILRSFFEIKSGDHEYFIKKKIKDKILCCCEDLQHTLPAFQELLFLKVDDEAFIKLEPKQKREKIFEAIRDLLISISRNTSLILVVEDLHWIDDPSAEFLDYMIEWIANSSIMMILLYRTEYRHRWGSKTYYHKIGLDHLGVESGAELVRAMLGDRDIAPELRNFVLRRAAGNPLFIEELTHSLIEHGSIREVNDQYVLALNMTEARLPDTVHGIIAARMDRLEENLKRTLQLASVIGRDFGFRILQTITGQREELKSYLLNLQGFEFIYEKRLFPELEYIFKHALTQEVAYNSLLLKHRKQIHEQIGEAVEELYSKRLEEFYEILAYHYSISDNFEKAFTYLKLSGQKAFSNYANQESFNYYKKAIDVINKFPDTYEKKKAELEVVLLMVNPLLLLGLPKEAIDILKNGEILAKELGERSALFSLYSFTIGYYTLNGNHKETIKYGEQIFFDALKEQDLELMALMSNSLVIAYDMDGQYLKIANTIPAVVQMIEEKNVRHENFGHGAYHLYTFLCGYCGFAFAYLGRFDESKEYLEKGLAYAASLDNPIDLAMSEMMYGHYFLNKFDGKNAIDKFQKSLDYFQIVGDPWFTSFCTAFSGYGYYLREDYDVALAHIEKGYEIIQTNDINWGNGLFPTLLSYVYYDLKEYDKARHFAEGVITSSELYDPQSHALSRISLGRSIARIQYPDSSEAETFIFQGLTILEELKMQPSLCQSYFYVGQFYTDAGQKEKALEYLNKSLSLCHEMGIDYWPLKIQALLDRQ